jgi:hypothetical protein
LLSISATIFKQFINIYLDIQGSGFWLPLYRYGELGRHDKLSPVYRLKCLLFTDIYIFIFFNRIDVRGKIEQHEPHE